MIANIHAAWGPLSTAMVHYNVPQKTNGDTFKKELEQKLKKVNPAESPTPNHFDKRR